MPRERRQRAARRASGLVALAARSVELGAAVALVQAARLEAALSRAALSFVHDVVERWC